jgi:heptosyltransferase-2
MSIQVDELGIYPPRVLVLRVGKLGDTIFMSSILPPLIKVFGSKLEIDVVVGKGLGDLFSSDPRVCSVFELSNRKVPIPFNQGKLKLILRSLKRPYDLVVNLETGWILHDLVVSLRAGRKVGAPYATASDDRVGEHAVERLRRIYSLFLPEDVLDSAVPEIVSPPGEASSELNMPRSYVVVNPTSSHFAKNDYRSYRSWPAPYWTELIGSLAKSRSVVVVGGNSERGFLNQIGPLPEGALDLLGKTSLSELMKVLASADTVVTTDTGPGHLAAALGTPVVAIFGPSDDRRTGCFPRKEGAVKILSARLECSPCSLTDRIKQCPWNRCMYEVTSDQVLGAVEDLSNGR